MTSVVTAAPRLIRVAAENPEAEFDKLSRQFSTSSESEILLAVDFNFCEYWRDEKNSVALTALFHLRADPNASAIGILLTEHFDRCETGWRKRSAGLADLITELPISLFPLNGPIPLQPIAIPKPWGQEIWYTGIEKRGIAEIGAAGRSVPLPWLLAAAPQRLTKGTREPILLKILDPLPEPVFGDLYFELHEQKQEVYVVTAIDRKAWPDGVGAIRFGFNSLRRNDFADDDEFLAAYLQSVREYRAVRQQIDLQIDAMRVREGIDLNAPVSAQILAGWMAAIDPLLQKREVELREQMESFTALKPLRIGDVVQVPCLLPHSLQHGVRTVEFQTPVYERLILSFAQKVLTQSEWDTERAADVLALDPAPTAAFPILAEGDGWREERIVQFDDFEVRRIALESRCRMRLGHRCGYGLGMVVGAALWLGNLYLDPDDAVLLPAEFEPQMLHNDNDEVAYFLLALPLAPRV